LADKDYAAALVDFLERRGQTEKKTLCYPITKVELMNTGDLAPCRTFIVVDGKWVETQ
jgi:hypothetical protein